MNGAGPSNGRDRRKEPAAQPVPAMPPPPAYVAAPTNGLAIAALVCGIVWLGGLGSILALVLGCIGVAGFVLLVLGLGCVAATGVDDSGGFGLVIVEP